MHCGRVSTHCARGTATEIEGVTEPPRAIRLAWMELDPDTGHINLSWQAKQEDGSWRQERATLEPGESHALLEQCREAAADFARRERGAGTDS